MAPRRQPIYELEEKIKGLQALLGCADNFEKFREKVGIDRDGLRACLNDTGTRGLNIDYQQKLADKVGFSLDWQEWIETDPERLANGTRRDGAAAFLDRCRRECFADAEPSVSQAKKHTDLPLKRGPRREPVTSSIRGLASIEIDGYQFGAGTTDIEVIVSCGEAPLLGRYVTIQRALVELDGGAALLTQESHHGWLKNPKRVVECGANRVRVAYDAGTRNKPRFRLAAASGVSIGNLILEPGLLAALEGLAPGEEVTVHLGTWLMDIQETDCCPPADGIAIVDDKGEEPSLPVEQLSNLKRNIIACLRKTLLPSSDGYVAVASHVLHVVEDVRDD